MRHKKRDFRGIRQFIIACRAIKQSGLLPGFGHKTVTQGVGMIELDFPRHALLKERYPRHGVRWDDAELTALIAGFAKADFDAKAFARRWRRKPDSVRAKLISLPLVDESYPWAGGLILFAGYAAAVAFPVKVNPQAITQPHTIHDPLAKKAGHFFHVLVGQHAGRAF